MGEDNMAKNTKMSLIIPIMMLMATALIMCPVPANAAIRATDVTVASEGNTLVYVPGEYETADISAILQLVNSYRREACRNGYPNPEDSSVQLTMADYTEVQWSGDLEWIAQTRAAEGAVYQSHTRPNGYSCFSVSHNGLSSSSETLAWNYGSLIGGIKQWYEEKEDWVAQNADAVTGHYTAMIEPDLKYIGIGCFTSVSGGWSCVAGAYSRHSDLSSEPQGIYGSCIQTMEVNTSSVSALSISGADSVAVGNKSTYNPEQYVSYPHIMGGTKRTSVLPAGTASWTVTGDTSAVISADGVLSPNKTGTLTVTVHYPDGSSASKSVKVTAPAKGASLVIDGTEYTVTKTSGEVAVRKQKGAKGKVVIPAEVRYCGLSYKVTSISDAAYKNNRKITSVKIGKNVRSIGKNAFCNCTKVSALTLGSSVVTVRDGAFSGCKALKKLTIPAKVASIGKKAFYNCKNLKTLTIKAKKLKAKTVGSKAFAKTGIKKVKTPGGKKKAYQEMLTAKGVSKGEKFS